MSFSGHEDKENYEGQMLSAPHKPAATSNPALVILAVFGGIALLGMITWFATWGYAEWKVSQVATTTPGDNLRDLAGTWTGTYSNTQREYQVTLQISESKPLSGTISYQGSPCGGRWMETSREYDSIYVYEKSLTLRADCVNLFEWKVSNEGNTMTGVVNVFARWQ